MKAHLSVALAAALGVLTGTGGLAFAQTGGAPRPAAGAEPAIRAAELAIETDSRALRVPAGGVGTLAIAGCDACTRQALVVGSETRFQVRDEFVPLSTFLQQLGGTRAVPVVVFYRPGSNDVTRIRVSAAPGGGRRGS